MKIITAFLGMALLLSVVSCDSSPSLQEYYVDNSENPNFIAIDLPASLLNIEETELPEEQQEALRSLRKLNILAFKKTGSNQAEFELEKGKVSEILKGSRYKDLMKINSPEMKGMVKYQGDDDAIDEVVIYGNNNEKGFALVRVLGEDMNPAHLMNLVKAIQKSDFQGEQLGALKDFISD
ncbi:DUF4252 domain-containing protein [Zeaxanthinibacter enoshimensis]|uniref:DUF4252 domain-containing protein n=1 Tax=Zeaxanthinibacter enoshimensis TaxID=392009 RepID=UPI0035635342